MFEIGSPETASGVVSSDVNLRLDDGEEEYDDEDYDPVTSLGPEDLGTTSFPDEAPSRGDTGTRNLRRVLAPRRLATDRPAGPATERTRPFQLPAPRFPQQHPQVIDVDEVEETEVGKAAEGAAGWCSDTWVSGQRTRAGGVPAVCTPGWAVRTRAWAVVGSARCRAWWTSREPAEAQDRVRDRGWGRADCQSRPLASSRVSVSRRKAL